MKLYLTATGCDFPYGITQFYLPTDTRLAGRVVCDLPTPEGWKTELT